MAGINIRDLSIGDWVEIDGEPAKALCLRIVGGLIFKGVSGQMYSCCDGMDFHPIPLTPEILEKNGFEEGLKNGEAYKIKLAFNQHLWLFKVGDGCCWMFRHVLGLFEDFDIVKVEIKYVHQLQHALRVAGVEKEIIM